MPEKWREFLASPGLTVEALEGDRLRVTGAPRSIKGWAGWVAQPTWVLDTDLEDVRLIRVDVWHKDRDDAPTLPSTLLRDVRPAQLRQHATDAQFIAALMGQHDELRINAATLEKLGRALHKEPKAAGRPREWSDLDLARLAERYVELVGTGVPPYPALVKEWRLPHSTIRGALALARSPERRLLTSVSQGVVGGKLTRKAKDILKKADR
jgi:hypothetical protein